MLRLVMTVLVLVAIYWFWRSRPADHAAAGPSPTPEVSFLKKPIDRANAVADKVRQRAQETDQP